MSDNRFADKTGDPSSWTTADLEAFLTKGEHLYRMYIRPALQRNGISPSSAFVVEYGSGMGRILKALHDDGFEVGGIDISPTMLEHSRRLVPEVVRLSTLDPSGRSSFPDACADFVFSYAVLQHIQTVSGVKRAVVEMCRLLKPGAYLLIQARPLDSPFVGLGHGGSRTLNLETSSFVLKTGFVRGRFCGRSYRIPGVKISRVDHNNWLGVPFSYRTLRKTLRENRTGIVGTEHSDSGGQKVTWILARKEPRS